MDEENLLLLRSFSSLRIGIHPLLLPPLKSGGSHTTETEGSSYLCRVLDSVLANYIERDEKNRLNL
ncbi:hypothetical protein HMPREF3185_01380 [Porphyromonas somerae]|uniref:Uncharacterized protein n=1 Tax=Porphyromonas somerae TaxID=322095 RepID=A0A134B690_9PORP|nr:hypothetical protein HMPREF3184_01380 [Porphyromonadaceae bacterium KA00676]KXB75456.1 hypothetical protein HMPREF3185_01380 [Porphyromonas somerae]